MKITTVGKRVELNPASWASTIERREAQYGGHNFGTIVRVWKKKVSIKMDKNDIWNSGMTIKVTLDEIKEVA